MLIIDDEHKTTMMYKKELMSANTPEELRKERLRLIGIDFANCFNDLFFYYSDRDASLKALDGLSSVIGLAMPIAAMPLGGAVDAWVEDTAKVAEDYIRKDFCQA